MPDGYAIALQRAIEYHCRGERIPAWVAVHCAHHAKMLDARLEQPEPQRTYGPVMSVVDAEGHELVLCKNEHGQLIVYASSLVGRVPVVTVVLDREKTEFLRAWTTDQFGRKETR